MSTTVLTFALNSVNYSLSPKYCQVVDYSMPFVGKPRLYERALAGVDGSVVQGYSVDPIRFRLDCVCKFSNTASITTTLDSIANSLAATIGSDVKLAVSWFPGRTWTVRLASEFAPKVALNGAFFTLDFVVPSGAED